jgi:hypothetical protein
MIKLDRPHAQFLESNHGCCFSQGSSAKNCIPSPYSILRWILGVNKWCLDIPQHPTRSPLPSWPYIDTIGAIIATHMWPKLVKICWKTSFASILLMNFFLGQQLAFMHTMRSPMIPFTLIIPSSYLMGHYTYPFMTKNGTKIRKTDFLTSASISLPYTQTVYHGPNNNVQPSYDITHNALHPHDPTQRTHRPSQLLIHDLKWQMVDKQVLSISALITSYPTHKCAS